MVLRESSQWFWNFINKTIYHVDWFERSSPSSTYLRAPWPTRSLWRLTTCKNKLKLTIKIWLGISVTRWLDYLFQIGLLRSMKICPIAKQLCQYTLNFLPNTKLTFSKWQKCCNVVPQRPKFAKSGHAAIDKNLVTLQLTNFIKYAPIVLL